MQKRISPPLNIYRQIAIAFIGIGFILILVIFYFSLTYAFIDITPDKVSVSKDFNFIVQEDAAKEDLSRGVFAGQLISQTVSKSGSFIATGTKEVNTSAKSGKIKIINNYSKSQTLVATTRFLSKDKVLFRLKDRVDVPAGGTVEGEIYIDNEEQSAAVSVGDKFTIPGLWEGLQDKIYGQALTDFSGEKSSVTVVSQSDIDTAINGLITQAKNEAVKDGENAIYSAEITKKSVKPSLDETAKEFTVSADIALNAIVFDKTKLLTFAKSLLEAQLTEDQELVEVDENISYEIEKFNLDNKIAQIKGKIVGLAVIRENSLTLDKSKLVKLSAAEAKAYLENLEGIKNADVKFFPFWTKRVPSFEDHIIIRINK